MRSGRSGLRRSVLGEVGALLLPARYAPSAPGSTLPVCSRCRCYCAIELVEAGPTIARVLVTCRRHKSSSGNDAQQLVTFNMVDSEWDEHDLGKCIRGVAWFEESTRNEDFSDVG
jgi:hypothetical protein